MPQTGPQLGHAVHADQPPHSHPAAVSHERVRVWLAQPPGHVCDCMSVWPGEQVPLSPPTHVLHAVQLPHWHVVLSHERERICVPLPHVPHACEPVSIIPAAQTPSSMQAHAPQVQSAWQTRVCVPHMPHVPPVSMSPGEHGPPPLQRPESVHTPSWQICCCIPQCMQAIVRGGSPAVQSQLVGAVHAPHVPFVQRSTPVPQLDEQARSLIVPTLGLASSQSVAAGTPSWSPSSVAGRHTPATHVSVPVHGGSHAGVPASGLAPSRPGPPSRVRGLTPSPLAHPRADVRPRTARAARLLRQEKGTTD